MAIPTVFTTVKPQDFTLTPIKVHKRFLLDSTTLVDTSSGYNIVDGVHSKLKTPIGAFEALNDPTNSFDGSYQHIVWRAYNHLYYRDGYNSYATHEHSNRRYTYKFLYESASVLSIPYLDYGESIQPQSLEVTSSTYSYNLRDDGNGNIYDIGIDTGSFTKSYTVISYWGFNDEFRNFRYFSGRRSGYLSYQSRVFEPVEKTKIVNIEFGRGVGNSGMDARFHGSSFMLTHDRPEYNPDITEEFTIAFWLNAPPSQSTLDGTTNSIISKRGVIRRQTYGTSPKYNQNDLLIESLHVSSSTDDEYTDIYPYDISIYNSQAGADDGKLRIRRSDGIKTVEMTSSISVADGQYHHIAYVMGSTDSKLYIDGILDATATMLNGVNIYNKHCIVFGATNTVFDQSFSGSLDEVRMHSTALTGDSVATLADSSSMAMYQTAVVGNIFYRQGNIIFTAPLDKYNTVLDGGWSIKYRGTHTIYQYEALCRIKKGSYNLTYNPTARKSYKSDIYINDMTGSLLKPYATTVGLYTDRGECVAVAKLGQAIQMRDDVDLNILVRWDA